MALMNDISSPPQPTPAEERPARQRKPDWIRVRAPVSEGYNETRRLMRELNLHTVCEEAACPNIGECWTKKHATVMILGDVCTRACAFCNVKTGMPKAVDPFEPENTAIAAAQQPVLMASAMRKAIEAGREAYLAGRMPKKLYASASSPIEGTFF